MKLESVGFLGGPGEDSEFYPCGKGNNLAWSFISNAKRRRNGNLMSLL
jgi:hypothetical protein